MLDPTLSEVAGDAGSAFSLKIREKLDDEQTPYQHIEILATEGFGNLKVIDGCTMLSIRDDFLDHETMEIDSECERGGSRRAREKGRSSPFDRCRGEG